MALAPRSFSARIFSAGNSPLRSSLAAFGATISSATRFTWSRTRRSSSDQLRCRSRSSKIFPRPSAIAKDRLALFDEGGRAFVRIGRAERERAEIGLDLQAVVQGDIQRPLDRGAGKIEHGEAESRELAGKGETGV